MDKTSRIKELLRSITGTDRPSFGFRLMEVVAVEGDLCRAKIDNLEIPDVRLSSIRYGSENGLLITPAEGSVILVADISCGNLRELCAVAYSEIESVRFHQGDTTVTADAERAEVTVGESSVAVVDESITLRKGESSVVVEGDEVAVSQHGSSVVVKDREIKVSKGDNSVVVDGNGVVINGGKNDGLVKVKELTFRINTLEKSINGLKAVFNEWMPVDQDGGKTLKEGVTNWAGAQLTTTQQSDIENSKVKH